MYRVVYCPKDTPVEDAYSLASEWGLSIQHGDSPRTESLDFDRLLVQVLSIPVDRGFEFDELEFPINRPAQIKYSNDWDDVKDYSFILRPYGLKVGKTAWDIPSMLMDTHRAAMNIAVSFPGKYELVSVKDGIERESMIVVAVGMDGEAIQ